MIVAAAPVSARRPAAPAAVDARPLYLAPLPDTRVTLDGPALCVSREEEAPRLFPLARFSRVVTATVIDWTSEALLACAECGISIVFMDEQGAVTARLTGRPGFADDLSRRLDDFLLLPQSAGMYRWWVRNYRRRAAQWAGLKIGIEPAARDPRTCRTRIERLAQGYAGGPAAVATRQWLRPPAQRELVQLFESRAVRVAERGREITGTLHRWLIHET